ncbi:imidazolonepropionase [Eubacterium sp. AB3007]|uniref:imidazolonepropionase n=1 Tax=Eubacterium sp. AB3007 TaxID=1392487 RepID=UPI0004871672|nr:imidazolonepropionase [Eubacterium sp. AB3007]
MSTLLVKNIGVLQTPTGSYSHKGEEQGQNLKMKDAAVLVKDGVIAAITDMGELPVSEKDVDCVLDANYRLVTPGLVDGHTHMVFGGYRQHEIPMKIKGATYLDILRAGGGILDTVRHTREAKEEDLVYKTGKFLDEMMGFGVTTVEAKSGYGLDMDTEIKMLSVIDRVNRAHAVDVVPTFMGAHAIPEEYKDNPDAYIDLLCDEMLPYVKEHDLAEFADVFTEDSVFDYAQSKKYLERAKELGFKLKIHADEIEAIGGSRLAGEIGAVSAEHLISINEEGLESMAKGGVTAMCLPATSFYLGVDFAPARRMIEMGIPVATASDFNPGSCPSLNLQFVMNLACIRYRLLPEEVLTAVTINPACAIGRGDRVGTLEVGKQADMVIWDAPDMEMLCYRFGSNLASRVIKKGKIVK